jgi:hypothetical protein
LTHEETNETLVLYNSKYKYFLLNKRRTQNWRLARAVTPRMGRGRRDIRREGMHGWMTWGDRTDDADVWTTERWFYPKNVRDFFGKKITQDDR